MPFALESCLGARIIHKGWRREHNPNPCPSNQADVNRLKGQEKRTQVTSETPAATLPASLIPTPKMSRTH